MKTETLSVNHNLYFEEAVNRWDEAIPLGSGLIGCLVWGDGAPLKFSLDRGDLWDTRPIPRTQESDYTYEELIRLVKDEQYDKIKECFQGFAKNVTPSKIPAGRLILDFGEVADNVESNLSLASAEANIVLHFKEKTSTVSTFMHAKGKYGFLHIEGSIPKIQLYTHDFTPQGMADNDITSLNTAGLHLLGYPAVEYLTKGKVQIALQHTATDLSFALMVASNELENATDAVYYVACSRDGENWLDDAALMLENALERGYDKDIKEHLSWWEVFWSKSSINLPDKFIEKNWYLTNYFLGSCSRKGCPPMPLQGVWTADEGKLPPWRGDYHADLNTQFSYYSFLKSDHIEEGESFLDFVWSLSDAARNFAKDFYDADGMCLPSTFDIDGKVLGGWAQYSYSITNHIWDLHLFYLYYKYTIDEKFLHERLYPLLKEAEKVVRRHLIEDDNGYLTLPISSSPEIDNDKPSAWFVSISNYDLSLLRFLYEALIELSPITCPTDVDVWEKVYTKLPPLAIEDGIGYKLSSNRNLSESHRHFSHIMPIYPLNQCFYMRSKQEKRTIDNSITHLENLGRKWWVGFSLPWMANLYARKLNGEKAQNELQLFFTHFCSQNGFNLNGDYKQAGISNYTYRPFTLEANMNAADAIQEMLMQCYDGVIRVFPAIPNSWKEEGCEFEGFLSYGGVKISSEIKDGKVSYVKLKPRKDVICKIYNPFSEEIIFVSSNIETYQTNAQDGIISIILRKDQEYVLNI